MNTRRSHSKHLAYGFGVVFGGAMIEGEVLAQSRERLDQDELTSFYGRANIVLGSGARALGMGGAFLARADDATAASWNPAGLSYLRRAEASVVGVSNRFSQDVSRVVNRNDVTIRQTGLDTLRATGVDFASAAFPLRLKDRLGAVQVAYQRVFSFSGDRNFDGFASFPGVQPRENSFTTVAGGGFDTVSVSSGLQIHPRVRIGVSLNRWFGGFDQVVDRFPTEPLVERTISSEWRIRGTNLNFGVLAALGSRLNLGAVYKTELNADLDLAKVRRDVERSSSGEVQRDTMTRYPSGGGVSWTQTLVLPRVRGGGLSFNATNQLTFSADVTQTDWSRATITNFVTLSGTEQVDPEVFPRPLPFPATEASEQADATQLRVGVEWIWSPRPSGSDSRFLIPLRAGFFRDGQPVYQTRLDSATNALVRDRAVSFNGFTFGTGIDIDGKLIDIAYVREGGRVSKDVDGQDRNVRYQRFLVSIIARFGQRR